MLDRPFRAFNRLDFDFELPPFPPPLDRVDAWFDRQSELQRVAIILLAMIFLAASSLYCLGLGSTVLVNRLEADLARATPAPTLIPTVAPTLAPPPTEVPTLVPTNTPVLPTPAPARTAVPPTPIPAQALPSVPQQARPAALDEQQQQPARPRIVAPPEPPTAVIVPAATAARPSSAAPPARTVPGAVAPTVTPNGVRPPALSTPRTTGPAPNGGAQTKPTVPSARPTAPTVFQPTPFPTAVRGAPAAKPTPGPVGTPRTGVR